jgi:hypothetical protein
MQQTLSRFVIVCLDIITEVQLNLSLLFIWEHACLKLLHYIHIQILYNFLVIRTEQKL